MTPRPKTQEPTFIGINEYEGEVRVTSGTGAAKGLKLARFDLVPWAAARALARHFGVGALKYRPGNWEAGYDWSLSIGAIERHTNAWKGGESVYVEEFTGHDGVAYRAETHHLIAVAWHAFVLWTFEQLGLGTDDRRLKEVYSADQPQ